MNRPRRPSQMPPRRRPGGPPQSSHTPAQQVRRRSPLDNLPADIDPPFQVLGVGDRQILQASAQPLEMVVIQGYTREIEETFQRYKGRFDDFWTNNPQLIASARKLDEILAGISKRKP